MVGLFAAIPPAMAGAFAMPVAALAQRYTKTPLMLLAAAVFGIQLACACPDHPMEFASVNAELLFTRSPPNRLPIAPRAPHARCCRCFCRTCSWAAGSGCC